ncbi:hypothetical protein G9464_20315 [Halostella sp. JP-L12]|uniref:DUF7344 domain-containing protein n=1 Tax=Halostella TaxID=1843185 RepID=UPI0013CE5273|nr:MULTISPECIES: hypothetical protein [Halostella]NHN49917.1 hypothetical protein [Halostella sp. JP-L12]
MSTEATTELISEASEVAAGVADETVLYEVLSDPQRRHALAALRRCGGTLALADLAMEVARMEADDETAFSKEYAQRVEIALYHNHVPRMTDAGVVEFDEERRVVRLHEDVLA